eukprot:gene3786-6947_t
MSSPDEPVRKEKEKEKKEKEKVVCKYFQKGKCDKGDSCPFLHENKVVCKYFLKGKCTNTECTFQHLKKDEYGICLKFLNEICLDLNCPYKHEKMSKEKKNTKPKNVPTFLDEEE